MAYQIAIDGPAGSGKSTIAKIIAKNNNLTFLSTGYLFRTYALIAIKNNLNENNLDELITIIKNNQLIIKENKMFLNDNDVTEDIKNEKISILASLLAAQPKIRELYNSHVKSNIVDLDVILDGRDIGTVIIPNANLKIYLTASIYQRAKRRQKEYAAPFNSFIKLFFSVLKRDLNDKYRKVSPLKKSADAIIINTDNKTIEQIVDKIQRLIDENRKV